MKEKFFVTAIFIATLITACGAPSTQAQKSTPDVAAIRTSAAGTVVSQFTLTAAAFTPTSSVATEPAATEPPATEVATQPPAVNSTATIPTQPGAQVTNAQGTTVAQIGRA